MSQVRPLLALVAVSLLVPATAAQARVLRVGTYHGHRGSYRTIQARSTPRIPATRSWWRRASTTSAATTRARTPPAAATRPAPGS